MTHPTNPFKQALESGRKLAGSWIMTSSPNAAEAMAWTGLDFIIVDMEHTDASLSDVIGILRAIAATPTQAIVRPPSGDPVIIRRILDAGATNIMVPFVDTPEQASTIVSATRYPPEGKRGFAMLHRGSRYAQDTGYLDRINNDICLIAQIETQTAVNNIDAIAKVNGIDALFFGPGDLSAVVGELGNTTGDKVKALMADAVRRCRHLGVASGTLAPNINAAKWSQEQGFDFISVSNDLGLIVHGSKAIAQALKS